MTKGPEQSPAFEVRPINPPWAPKLIADLAALHQAGFDRPWSPESLRRTLDGKAVRSWAAFVSGDKTRPVGFLTCQWLNQEAEILTFAVAPALRRTGVGRALLNAMVVSAKAEHLSRVFLEVEETNLGALRLYQRVGFVRCGCRKGYYAGKDAVVMEYSL